MLVTLLEMGAHDPGEGDLPSDRRPS
jgi:hypothetical protein